MADIVVGIVLIIIILLAIGSMLRYRKKGKSLHCGGDCSKCGVHCK